MMIYLLLNSTAALHTSAPCPRVMSSGKDSSSSRDGGSFLSKCTSKVDARLKTAGREGTKKTTVSIASIVFSRNIPIHFPAQLLLQYKWPVAAGIQLKLLFPWQMAAWRGHALVLQVKRLPVPGERPGWDLHTLLWLKLSRINGFLQTRVLIFELTIGTLPNIHGLWKKSCIQKHLQGKPG